MASIGEKSLDRAVGRFAGLLLLGGAATATSGCLDNSACGVCDPENLILESIAAINYTGRQVNRVSPPCVGENCPDPFDDATRFIERIVDCTATEEANDHAESIVNALVEERREADSDYELGDAERTRLIDDAIGEFCTFSPLMVEFGLEFVFNNSLEPSTIELVRKQPANFDLFETYDWKTRIAEIRGPITRYNGDVREHTLRDGYEITRLVNLTCIDNLGRQPEPGECDGEADGRPLRMQPDGVFKATRGRWDARPLGLAAGSDCEDPETGTDDCCSYCDYALSVQVAKYGGTEGEKWAPGAGAVACDPTGDPLTQCRTFKPWVERGDETLRFGDDEARLPAYDRLRELHPDDRDPEVERITAYPQCTSTAQCLDSLGYDLPGTQCIGQNDEGAACLLDSGGSCTEGRCRPEWFGTCAPSLGVGEAEGYCVDRRYSESAAAGCYVDKDSREPLAECDADEDGRFEASECCTGSGPCDPIFADYEAKDSYDRAGSLPYVTRACVCGVEDDRCEAFDEEVDGLDEEFPLVCAEDERDGEFAVQFVTRQGGVIYDGSLKGVKWIAADQGGVPRAGVESCAEVRGLIGERNVQDGWRAHDDSGTQVENFEDFDRAMCSGQTYTIRFETDPGEERIVDKADNTLAGKSEYTFRTSEFHVVPGSGVPADNGQINVCDALGLRFSNKPDLSPENLSKIQILSLDGSAETPIAGGPGCARTAEEQTGDAVPCLTFDLSQHGSGLLRFWVDPTEFTPVLEQGRPYAIAVPGVETIDAPAADRGQAFLDACGMPLVLGDVQSYVYEFTIDEPACEQDEDGDKVPLSCDNAPGVANSGQDDIDRDGTGDAEDLCPTVASSLASTLDADGDGVGDACDNCRLATKQYNAPASGLALLDRLWIRNVPTQVDSDGDGIGDVCDNCVATPNCPQASEGGDPALCQLDENDDMVGDECFGSMLDGAAGVVGLGPSDDFDQDGLVNEFDGCPRQPVDEPLPCAGPDECPAGRECIKLDPDDATGSCNHLDTDLDGIGDACDSCVGDPNPEQLMLAGDDRGFADDPDGDFVGSSCEPSNECTNEPNPRVLGFYDVAAAGACCTTALVELEDGGLAVRATGEPLVEPTAGLPVRLQCDDPQACRALPVALAAAPGIVELPPGCDEALGNGSVDDNPGLTLDDVAGNASALWERLCALPQRDQDFDGLADACDLCPFAFDPLNEEYVDEDGRTWPNTGKYCSGDYGPEATCEDETTGTGTGTGG